MKSLLTILVGLSAVLASKKKFNKKMNPGDTVQLTVHHSPEQTASQKMNNQAGDSIFQ